VKAHRSFAIIAAICFVLTGCGIARYAKVQVHVVDEETQQGIPRAHVRTYYIKPMLDMTDQHKVHKRTDLNGFATISVATNRSQWTFLGWTHGIIPVITANAEGYKSQKSGLALDETGQNYRKEETGNLTTVVIQLKQRPATDLERP
jgi:hypothetical protein